MKENKFGALIFWPFRAWEFAFFPRAQKGHFSLKSTRMLRTQTCTCFGMWSRTTWPLVTEQQDLYLHGLLMQWCVNTGQCTCQIDCLGPLQQSRFEPNPEEVLMDLQEKSEYGAALVKSGDSNVIEYTVLWLNVSCWICISITEEVKKLLGNIKDF